MLKIFREDSAVALRHKARGRPSNNPTLDGLRDPVLVRVPCTDLHLYGTLWHLTQGETRKTKRVRPLIDFVSAKLAAYASLFAGRSVSRD